MDDSDRADGRIEATVEDGIAKARRMIGRGLPAIGVCHYCESAVPPGRTFCSKECVEDYEYERQRRAVNGR